MASTSSTRPRHHILFPIFQSAPRSPCRRRAIKLHHRGARWRWMARRHIGAFPMQPSIRRHWRAGTDAILQVAQTAQSVAHPHPIRTCLGDNWNSGVGSHPGHLILGRHGCPLPQVLRPLKANLEGSKFSRLGRHLTFCWADTLPVPGPIFCWATWASAKKAAGAQGHHKGIASRTS